MAMPEISLKTNGSAPLENCLALSNWVFFCSG